LLRMKTDEQLLNEIVQWPQKRVELAVEQRKLMYASIFKRFGDVTHFSPDWEKGYIHVTYKSQQSANAAMKSLKEFETRAAIVRALKESSFRQALKECFPSPSFYVRWTTCYQRKIMKKAKVVAEQKLAQIDAAVARNAVAAANPASSSSSSSSSKKNIKKQKRSSEDSSSAGAAAAASSSSGVASSSSYHW